MTQTNVYDKMVLLTQHTFSQHVINDQALFYSKNMLRHPSTYFQFSLGQVSSIVFTIWNLLCIFQKKRAKGKNKLIPSTLLLIKGDGFLRK